MPRKNHTKIPQKAIDRVVARAMAGENSGALASEYKISRATVYLWVQKYRRNLLEQAARKEISPKKAALADKRALIAQIQELKSENVKLGNKVVALMLRLGEI